jgi:hypothetical protein
VTDLEEFDHGLASFETRLASELPAEVIHATAVVEDVQHGQIMALSSFEVIGVVRGRDFDRSCSESHVDQLGILHAAGIHPLSG